MLCAVNASVIMVNVFDDNSETELTSERQACNFRACDQLCRRLGFPSGTCVNGRCKCDNSLKADNPETEMTSERQACNFRACDQLCRRLGFPSGTCVNGRCKCDNFLDEVPSSIVNAFSGKGEESNRISRSIKDNLRSSATSCELIACDVKCKRQGRTGGFCSPNSTCFCY